MDQGVVDLVATELGVTNLERLREGGQKYVAKCQTTTDHVVLKIVSLIGTANPEEALERARREVELLEGTDSPNIVRLVHPLRSVGEPAVAVAWLEEYLDGEDLTDRLGVPWDWAVTRSLGLDLARGLDIMHGKDVVHRDLSPNPDHSR